MSITLNIQKQPELNFRDNIKITRPEDIYNLKEVQEIKDALQEHLLLVGLDNGNCIRNINILGIGSSNLINIDSKEILRISLINAYERIILIHNHPSNSLKPSNNDLYLTDVTYKFLKVFNINLLDHIIATKDNFLSMGSEKYINVDFVTDKIDFVENTLLAEENKKLKYENKNLQIKINEILDEEYEEEQ